MRLTCAMPLLKSVMTDLCAYSLCKMLKSVRDLRADHEPMEAHHDRARTELSQQDDA
jgi:hypothetical protein